MKKLILLLTLLLLTNCASINKFTYDSCYKNAEIRLIGGDPYVWNNVSYRWDNLKEAYEYSMSKHPMNRNHLDTWNIEMYTRYDAEFQAILERTK